MGVYHVMLPLNFDDELSRNSSLPPAVLFITK